jgi:soluble lytic murein transglycosylase-like protein
MTSAPILRSAALQRALGVSTGRQQMPPTQSAGAFADTLAHAQSKSQTPTGLRATAAAQWSAASNLKPSAGQARATQAAATQAVSSGAGSSEVPFKDLIETSARRYGVDPALLAALVKQESNFNPNAKSGAGAKGLTQLMDATARGLGVTDSFDPVQSLDGGARFLGGLLKQFKGNESLALAAYNAGPGAVQKYGGIPPYEETQRYVPKVLGYVTQYRRIWAP